VFFGLNSCLLQVSNWTIENKKELQAKNFRTDIIFSINTNPTRTKKAVFEDVDQMIDIVSIITDGVDVARLKYGYDAEVNQRRTIFVEKNKREKLRLVFSKRFNTWTLYLVPFGYPINASAYDIPWDTKKIVFTYRLLSPDGNKSTEMTSVVRIR
jgi:hypothetical protein